MPEDTVDAIAAKRAAFAQAEDDQQLSNERLRCDLFCAAFFAPKSADTATKVPLSGDLVRAAEGQPMRPGVAELARELAAEHHFFHWKLAFPEVFSQGGFDVVLANPPWERIKLQEQEFFGPRSPEIANAANAAARTRLIEALNAANAGQADKRLYRDFIMAKRGAEGTSLFAHDSERFPLTGVGDVNLYALFAESIAHLIGGLGDSTVSPAPTFTGRAGMIVPTGIATDDSTKAFFDAIATKGRIASLYDFENREKLFPAVDSRMKFCALTLGKQEAARFVFFATNTSQLRDERRAFTLSGADIALLNPNTRTCPVFRSQSDAELTKKIYRSNFILRAIGDGVRNSWDVRLRTMFHKSADAEVLKTKDELFALGALPQSDGTWSTPANRTFLPVYEGKYGWQFSHRYASHEAGSDIECSDAWLSSPSNLLVPELYCDKEHFAEKLTSMGLDNNPCKSAFLGFRRVSSSTNERTSVACVFPWLPSTYGWILTIGADAKQIVLLNGAYNSLVFDFLLRNSLSQPSIPQGVFEQVSLPPLDRFGTIDLDFIVPRILELTYTAHDLAPFASDLGYDGPPFAWNPERRALLRAELDAWYAKLYGLTRDELRYILDPADIYGDDYPSETFRGLKNNEIRQFGEYRTRRLVLEAWDRLAGS